jgi:hypothetical protein
MEILVEILVEILDADDDRGGQSPPLCDPSSKYKADLNGKSLIK